MGRGLNKENERKGGLTSALKYQGQYPHSDSQSKGQKRSTEVTGLPVIKRDLWNSYKSSQILTKFHQ